MKKFSVVLLTGAFLGLGLTNGLVAQEKAEAKTEKEAKVAIKVVKEGKAVLDTTMEIHGELDQEMIDKMIAAHAGDEVSVNIMKAHKKAAGVKKPGQEKEITMTIVAGEDCEKEVHMKIHGDEAEHVVWVTEGEAGEHKVIKMKSVEGKEGVKAGKKIMITQGEHGEEAVFEVITDVADIEPIVTQGYKIEVDDSKVVKGEEVKDILFFSDDAKVHNVQGVKLDGGFAWTAKEEKRAIQLKPLDDGMFRLEVNTDDTEAVVIEVFNATGDRLYKKKVRNYYGRFLQEIELSDNESAFYTVKVTQGEREIIGEFEF